MFLEFTFERKVLSRQNSQRCQRKFSIHKQPLLKLHINAGLRFVSPFAECENATILNKNELERKKGK